jgi:hypothetical protein
VCVCERGTVFHYLYSRRAGVLGPDLVRAVALNQAAKLTRRSFNKLDHQNTTSCHPYILTVVHCCCPPPPVARNFSLCIKHYYDRGYVRALGLCLTVSLTLHRVVHTRTPAHTLQTNLVIKRAPVH